MNARPAVARFAREFGYTGQSHAMLDAFESIRQLGITQARNQHFERKRLVDEMKKAPAMFFAAIHPALCASEAIEDANRVIFGFRNLPTWRRENRQAQLVKAKHVRVLARYFRKYGKRLWIREAA